MTRSDYRLVTLQLERSQPMTAFAFDPEEDADRIFVHTKKLFKLRNHGNCLMILLVADHASSSVCDASDEGGAVAPPFSSPCTGAGGAIATIIGNGFEHSLRMAYDNFELVLISESMRGELHFYGNADSSYQCKFQRVLGILYDRSYKASMLHVEAMDRFYFKCDNVPTLKNMIGLAKRERDRAPFMEGSRGNSLWQLCHIMNLIVDCVKRTRRSGGGVCECVRENDKKCDFSRHHLISIAELPILSFLSVMQDEEVARILRDTKTTFTSYDSNEPREIANFMLNIFIINRSIF